MVNNCDPPDDRDALEKAALDRRMVELFKKAVDRTMPSHLQRLMNPIYIRYES